MHGTFITGHCVKQINTQNNIARLLSLRQEVKKTKQNMEEINHLIQKAGETDHWPTDQ